ncbi:lysine N(6)-hydroxylase/L-ornithine N(5)-oxygenase family protein [Haloarchaeobius amylolyticus]|uniref:Lysine N(6)-hydroxylase/L-ornithine N(5)-oxygenase family protein n=1 Tax=Haloarchaeobius amylolyticus TaxID=1198296 RepID=A0ABD6BIS5_9EURY
MSDETLDVVGIGLGPFNLSLAALLEGAPADVDAVFLEQESEFSWHEGILIEGTTLEVPFLADLVTITDPTNEYSFLNYLRTKNRIYEFYTYRKFEIPRQEYNEYCRWVAESINGCLFSRRVTAVESIDEGYRVVAENPTTDENYTYRTENIVIGVGTEPNVPNQFANLPSEDVFHTASYLDRRERCLGAESVTVIGSGQSAAEVMKDLVEYQSENDFQLDWVTRSDGFFQLEESKLAHHHFTPDYIDYFYQLDVEKKERVLSSQDHLYKGIDKSTGDELFDILYRRSIRESPDVRLLAETNVKDIEYIGTETAPLYELSCEQWRQNKTFSHKSEVVILGTGYKRSTPDFLRPITHQLELTKDGKYKLDRDYRIPSNGYGTLFAQNAGLHTHGMNTAHLGLGCYRNAVIVNRILERQLYPEDTDTGFQCFDVNDFIECTVKHKIDGDQIISE